jgi:NADPH:quinone reductase-like Zn-dependent oxidoreductase
MRAAIYRGPGDIAVEEVPKPEIREPTDAIVRVTHTAICGSDLRFYRGESDREKGSRVGHEPMGIVEAVGDDVQSVEPGDRVFGSCVTNPVALLPNGTERKASPAARTAGSIRIRRRAPRSSARWTRGRRPPP